MKQRMFSLLFCAIVFLFGMGPTFAPLGGKTISVAESVASTPVTPNVLPDAFYFLNESGQIARLEADGVQVTQITHEAATVTDFDVAPGGERLAYITNNSLLESDAQGEHRRMKVQGVAFNLTDQKERVTQALHAVLYTPDGQQITFGRNGVNWIASGDQRAEAQMLLANDPFPDPQKPESRRKGGNRFVGPAAWSPDGQRLLFSYYYYASDDFGFGVFDLTTRQPTKAKCPRACAWSQDSQALFFIENVYGPELGARLSLSRADAKTGERIVLVQGAPTGQPSSVNPYRFFQGVYQASDGSLLTFSEIWPETPARELSVHHYALQRISVDGSQITSLRTDKYTLEGETLWATDGGGVLINDVRNKNIYPRQGPLLWLSSTGRPAVELPVSGYHMRWRTRPVVRTPITTPIAVTTVSLANNTQVTTLDMLNVRNGPGLQYNTVIADAFFHVQNMLKSPPSLLHPKVIWQVLTTRPPSKPMSSDAHLASSVNPQANPVSGD
ncbi:MAG: hypothetical protein U0350_26625 [Caldilineaceae bacterium]